MEDRHTARQRVYELTGLNEYCNLTIRRYGGMGVRSDVRVTEVEVAESDDEISAEGRDKEK